MKHNALYFFALACIPMIFSGCLGELDKSFNSPLDSTSTSYWGYPQKSLAETGGMLADFEEQLLHTNLDTGITLFGPNAANAAGTVYAMKIDTNKGPATSPKGALNLSATFGTGNYNYAGVYLNLRDGLDHPISLRAYQGISLMVLGSAGNLDVKIENTRSVDFNDPGVKLSEIPNQSWERIYIDFHGSAMTCHLTAGCFTFDQVADSITGISFQITGFAGETRSIDLDEIQLIPIGGSIPSDAKEPSAYSYANFVLAQDSLIDDFNRTTQTTVSPTSGTGLHAFAWEGSPTPVFGILQGNAPAKSMPNAAYMDFTINANSGADLQLQLEASFAGTDLRTAKGISFYARLYNVTNSLGVQGLSESFHFSYKYQPDFNVPSVPLTLQAGWNPYTILFSDVTECSYGSNCTVSLSSVLDRLVSMEIDLKNTGTTPISGRLMLDDVRLIY